MDEDEELRRAIELSLEEARNPPPRRRQETPGSDDDDDDDDDAEAQFQRDLEAAIKASKQGAPQPSAHGRHSDSTSGLPAPTTTRPVIAEAADGGARTRAAAAATAAARADDFKRTREEGEAQQQPGAAPAKRQRHSPPVEVELSQESASACSEARAGASSSTSALYWEGELRQTANRLVDKDKDTRPVFRLSEILGPKSDIAFAILSSYSNMVSWLYDFFDQRTPIVIINQSEDGNAGVVELAPNMLMTKPFLRGGRGCMHIKLILSVWLQDIPMRPTPVRHDDDGKASDFPGTLERVLHSLNVPAALTKFIDGDFANMPIEALSELGMRWDWTKVRVKLVASLAGKHEGWDEVERTGHPALMKAVQELGAETPKGKELVLECQGSSIGTYTTEWMNEFHCSARGETAKTWMDKPRSERAKEAWPAVKIVFPSTQTVKDSVLGIAGAGTMFCRKEQWEGKKFPRELFYDSNSKRGRVLMHSKVRLSNRTNDDMSLNLADDRRDVPREGIDGPIDIGGEGGGCGGGVGIVNYEMGIVIALQSEEEAERVACWRRPARNAMAPSRSLLPSSRFSTMPHQHPHSHPHHELSRHLPRTAPIAVAAQDVINPRILDASIRDVCERLSSEQKAEVLIHAMNLLKLAKYLLLFFSFSLSLSLSLALSHSPFSPSLQPLLSPYRRERRRQLSPG
ncbi:hypothetical protein EW145_g3542, partial [Phellinidium pouzarii]